MNRGLSFGALLLGLSAATCPAQSTDTVYVTSCCPDTSGNLVSDEFDYPLPSSTYSSLRVTLSSCDPFGANRFRVVVLGDGYREEDLPDFHEVFDNIAANLLTGEPFATYAPLIQLRCVEVISNDSGIDINPGGPGEVLRDTAMDMSISNPGGRYLPRANAASVADYAATAGTYDRVILVGNDYRFSGAAANTNGGDRWLAMMTGPENSLFLEAMRHECGHTFAQLGDEYLDSSFTCRDYPSTANDRLEPNISKYDMESMVSEAVKWWQWEDVVDSRFDGPVSTYEGAALQWCTGLYRPSPNSKMRGYNRPFNGPSAEALVLSIYEVVRPIDSHTPNDQPLTGFDVVSVQPVQPIGHSLDVTWRIGSLTVGTGTTLRICDLGLAAGSHTLTAEVVDNTDMVRDEEQRAVLMSQDVSWTVNVAECPADVNGDGVKNSSDVSAFLTVYTSLHPRADLNCDGVVNSNDYSTFLTYMYGTGCD